MDIFIVFGFIFEENSQVFQLTKLTYFLKTTFAFFYHFIKGRILHTEKSYLWNNSMVPQQYSFSCKPFFPKSFLPQMFQTMFCLIKHTPINIFLI